MSDQSTERPATSVSGAPAPNRARPVECTAVTIDGEARPNVLFTPPCTCSNCAPDRSYEHTGSRAADGWLRMSGSNQRLRVEDVELGAAGRALLG